MNPNIYFHLGYPKAASTTIQKSLLYNHSDIINLGSFPRANVGIDDIKSSGSKPAYVEKDERIRKLYKMLFHEQPTHYSKTKAAKLFNSILIDYISGCKPVFFSSEFALSARFSLPDIVEKIRRVSDLGHSIKIIIIIRSQQDLLLSLYRDHPFDPFLLARRRKYVTLNDFIDIDSATPFYSHCSSLDYFSLYKVLMSLFPADNILILPMEMMKEDLIKFSNRLASFCSLENESVYSLLKSQHHNQGSTLSYNCIRRIASFVAPLRKYIPAFIEGLLIVQYKKLLGIAQYLGAKQKLKFSQNSLRYIEATFGESNTKLSKVLSIDLGDFGYPVD